MSIAEAINSNDVWDLLPVRRRALKRRWGAAPNVEDVWNLLQQPIHPTRNPGYQLLRAALDVGWYVEEPVYLRPRWGEGDARVYHFILRRAPLAPPRLITIPESPEIERFVRDERLRILVSK